LSDVVPDVAAWARAHEACFELAPLVEMIKGRKLQVGFTISFYARLAMEMDAGTERRADAAKDWQVLREIAESLVPKEGSRARVEVEAPRAAAYFRPESQMKPEIALVARVFHGDDYSAEVTPGERDSLAAVAKRLTEIGLKQGHW
jgi:hypothetical protein